VKGRKEGRKERSKGVYAMYAWWWNLGMVPSVTFQAASNDKVHWWHTGGGGRRDSHSMIHSVNQ
jgi:hypothetical protein